MAALEMKPVVSVMEIYLSCPHCQRNYLCAERFEEHVTNCHMESSSFFTPNESHPLLNPQLTVDLNVDSELLPIRSQLIQKEPQEYTENDHTDFRGHTHTSAGANPPEIYQDELNHRQLELETTGSEPKILCHSIQNPNSTCNERGFLCRYCPRTFPEPSVARQHEECHRREPKYVCLTCGERFGKGVSLIHHRKSHLPAPAFESSFRPAAAESNHENTHPRRGWTEWEWRPRILKKNQSSQTSSITIIPKCEQLCLRNKDIEHQPIDYSIEESLTTDQNGKSSKNTPPTTLTDHIKPHDGAGSVQSNFEGDQICGEVKENQVASSCHLPEEESQAEQCKVISTPDDKSCVSVPFTLPGDQKHEEVQEKNEAASNLPENLKARTQQKGPVPRYPIVKMGGKKFFCCGFPGCNEVFNCRFTRYKHQKTYHNDAPRSTFTYLPDRFSGVKANATSCSQLQKYSDDEKKKKTDTDSPPTFPCVQVDGKKYFWCDFLDCGIVNRNVEAMCLHKQRHEMSSEETTIKTAESSTGTDSKKPGVEQKGPKLLQIEHPAVVDRKEDEMLGETTPLNQSKISDFPMQDDDEEMSDQTPMRVLVVVLDEDFEVDEQEMLENQSMDTLQFAVTDEYERPMEHTSIFNQDFNAENIFQTDSGLGSELSTETNASNLNPARPNISNPTSTKEKVVSHRLPVKDRKVRSRNAWQSRYPKIKIGTKILFCCDFPGCSAVFNNRTVRYAHFRRHGMGFKDLKSKLRLTEDGMVWDSAEGCYVVE